ncbi:hypothetical protein DXG03_001745 [Asterophora parasitica]|uniref:PX domain-containing protein n=1 Tax=Asterophora parasitica TaxID=117018 RepID=A0A9P7GGQ4_9AGAR|nr:hypothetical protein DXG03_001745 [Asterophora parasitica]
MEYDIWRRWEDCLSFQNTIEEEYRRMARAKRLRLQRGKGIKRDGFYKQDAASSWESLPPGPDPNSVGRDIHDYIPLLNRKGTVFRASQATIDLRATELAAFMHDLWKDGVPALIVELRNDCIVTDFFAYWRRDHEVSEKRRKQREMNSRSRTSVTSSIFSMYFSSSNPSIQDLGTNPSPGNVYPESITTSRSASSYTSTYQSSRPPSRNDTPRNRKTSTDSSDGSPLPKGRRRAYSTGSSNFSISTPSDFSLDSPVQDNMPVPAVADDVHMITFDHNPQWQSNYVHERSTPALSILPEGREMCLKTTPLNPPPLTRRRRKSSAAEIDLTGRNGSSSISSSPPPRDVPSPIGEGLLTLPDRSVRESWQTMDSASYILEGIDMTMPPSPSATERDPHRASVSSVATFMTNVSVDGVLPRVGNVSQPSSIPRSLRRKTRVISCPVSISEFDNDWSDSEDSDILDSFLGDSFPMPAFEIPYLEISHDLLGEPQVPEDCTATPLRSSYSDDAPTPSFAEMTFTFAETTFTPSSLTTSFTTPPSSETTFTPSSLTASFTTPPFIEPTFPHDPSPAKSSTFTVSTRSSNPHPDKLMIKAKYTDSLIMLRVSNAIKYKDLRQRLYNKFVGQEGIPLSDSFKIEFVQPVAGAKDTSKDETVMYPVTSEADWENVAACIEGYKLTLHVYDNTA